MIPRLQPFFLLLLACSHSAAESFEYTYGDLMLDEKVWPERVILNEEIQVEVTINGRQSGTIKTQKGGSYVLSDVHPDGTLLLVVGSNGVEVEHEKTNFLEAAAGIARSFTLPQNRTMLRRELIDATRALPTPSEDALASLTLEGDAQRTSQIEGITRIPTDLSFKKLETDNITEIMKRLYEKVNVELLRDIEHAALIVGEEWQNSDSADSFAPLQPAFEFLAGQVETETEKTRILLGRLALLPTMSALAPEVLAYLAEKKRPGAIKLLLLFFRVAETPGLRNRTAEAMAKPELLRDDRVLTALEQYLTSEENENNRPYRQVIAKALREAGAAGNVKAQRLYKSTRPRPEIKPPRKERSDRFAPRPN